MMASLCVCQCCPALLLSLLCSYGAGSNDGCLSAVPFDTDGSSAALRSNPAKQPADKLRNIYTTAPKTGGYGQPWKDMTLGEPPTYYADVYEGGREREKVREQLKTTWTYQHAC